MSRKVKITKDLDIDYADLMLEVDASQSFTLRDVIRATVSSTKIPVDIMSQILRCRYISEYWKEIESKPFEDKGDIAYLELYYSMDCVEGDNGVIDYGSSWGFHGCGKVGVVPSDMKEFCRKDYEWPKDYQVSYAIELSPLYELADYEIKIRNSITMEDVDKDLASKETIEDHEYPFRPSITVLEVLYWVVWELSFFGSAEERDEIKEDIMSTKEEFDEAKKNGTLNYGTAFEDLDKEE